MDRIPLNAQERTILGKKVKSLRRDGVIPGHVYGKNLETESVSVSAQDFNRVFHQAGETGLVDLKIGTDKIRPVLIRDIQYDPLTGRALNIDFYQVNLKEKVTVPVPIEIIGQEPESVHMGEAVVLQNLAEVEVEALPTDLIEKIEVDITNLKQIDDAILVSQLNYDRNLLTVLADEEEVVVKLAPAVTEEMKALLEEQEAEAEAAAAEQAAEEGTEGEETTEGEAAEGEEGSEAVEGTEGESAEVKSGQEAKKDETEG